LTDNFERTQEVINRLETLAARLTGARRLYLETTVGVELPPRGRGRCYWIVARELCRFFRVPLLAEAARAHQRDALALDIRRLSPFELTGSHYHLSPGFASLWLWDQQRTQTAGAAVGVDVSRVRVLPEPALLPAMQSGVRLIETLRGFDGQYWDKGGLSASRWWPRVPDERAWILFLRGASVAPDLTSPVVPAAIHLSWLERRWTKTRNTNSFDLSRLDLRLVAAGAAAVLLVAYGYQVAESVRVGQDLRRLAQEIDARSTAIEPLLSARTQALDNQSAVRALRQLDPFPDQLSLMAQVAEVLPGDGTHFIEWLYDRGHLDLTLAGDQPLDVVRFVRLLERSGAFNGVAAERTGNNNTLRLGASVEAR
jgi:hypothetical protein